MTWLCVGETCEWAEGQRIQLDGEPGERTFWNQVEETGGWEEVAAEAVKYQALCLLPAGLPVPAEESGCLSYQVAPGRRAPYRAIRHRIRSEQTLVPGFVAEALVSMFSHLLPMADGAALPAGVQFQDALASVFPA